MRTASVIAAPRGWQVLCDFDGTITLGDVTDSLLLCFGRPGWQDLEDDWTEGRIGSRECMAGQVALLECSAEQLQQHLLQVEIDPAFPAFVAAVEALGWPLTVVSDGLDAVVRGVLERHGCGHLRVAANHLESRGGNAWRLSFPHGRAGCPSGTCKCAFASGASGRRLLIGDGVSDFCVAARADLTWARGRLLGHCIETRLPHRAVADFRQALDLLPALAREAGWIFEEQNP